MTNSTFNFSVKLMPFSSLMTVICKLALGWFFFVFAKKWPSHGLSLLKLRFQHISADFPKFITIYYDYQSNIIAKKEFKLEVTELTTWRYICKILPKNSSFILSLQFSYLEPFVCAN